MKIGDKVIHPKIGKVVIVGVGVGSKSDMVIVDFGDNLKDLDGNNTWLECKTDRLKEEQ